jgi:DNA-binding transcriptional ArsR family regulator
MSAPETIIDPRLAKAAAHPLRMRILGILNQRVASPVEIARELDEPLANVSYHVKMLESLECIELVSTTPRRGAVEHHYRALERAILSADDMDEVPLTVRRGIADGLLTQIVRDVHAAAEGEGFDRPDVHISRVPMTLDEEGFAQMSSRLSELLEEVLEIQAASAKRIAKTNHGEPPEALSVNLVWLLFEQAPARAKSGAKKRARKK